MAKREMRTGVRVLLMVVIDLVLLGIALCTFAYFHHVRQPEVKAMEMPTPIATPTPAPTPAEPTPEQPVETIAPEAPTPEPEPTVEPEPAVDTGLLGGKYAELFTDGEIEQDETHYRSANVCMTLTEERMYDSLVHIVDIYVKDISSFCTVLPNEDLGTMKMKLADISKRMPEALVLTSSDQFRNRSSSEWGFILRNGLLYADNLMFSDICVLYNDGGMEVYQKGTAVPEEIYARGAHQAWSFGPILVQGGAAMAEFPGGTGRSLGKNPRMGIGYYEPGHYCLVLADGSRGSDSKSKGLSMDEFAELFASLGCENAYNLDGGETAAMLFGGRLLNKSNRNVTDGIYIKEPDIAPDVAPDVAPETEPEAEPNGEVSKEPDTAETAVGGN